MSRTKRHITEFLVIHQSCGDRKLHIKEKNQRNIQKAHRHDIKQYIINNEHCSFPTRKVYKYV
jgi:hypothetical protein